MAPVRPTGSGFLIDTLGGVLITNEHVVAGGQALSVTIDSGLRVPARVVVTDHDADLAVVVLDASEDGNQSGSPKAGAKGGIERGGRAPQTIYEENQWVVMKDVAYRGYYILPIEVFAPDSAGAPPSIVVQIDDLKQHFPSSPAVLIEEPTLVERVARLCAAEHEQVFSACAP